MLGRIVENLLGWECEDRISTSLLIVDTQDVLEEDVGLGVAFEDTSHLSVVIIHVFLYVATAYSLHRMFIISTII